MGLALDVIGLLIQKAGFFRAIGAPCSIPSDDGFESRTDGKPNASQAR